MVIFNRLPTWVRFLLTKSFFMACGEHRELANNSKNILCLDCSQLLCSHCEPTHASCYLLEMRKLMRDGNEYYVVRKNDILEVMDARGVQAEELDDCKVVFLNQTPLPTEGSENYCEWCNIEIKKKKLYCCIACKIDVMQIKRIKRSAYIHYRWYDETSPERDDGQPDAADPDYPSSCYSLPSETTTNPSEILSSSFSNSPHVTDDQEENPSSDNQSSNFTISPEGTTDEEMPSPGTSGSSA